MLRWRILLGAVFIGALVGLIWLDTVSSTPGLWLFLLAMAIGLGAAGEMVQLLVRAGYQPLSGVIFFGTLCVVASNGIGLFWLDAGDERPLERLAWPLLAFVISLIAALAGEMWRYQRPGGAIVNVALAVYAVAYVGLLLSFAVQLRVLGGPISGAVAVVALLAVVKLGDIGAYTVGRLVGRHKMSPLISPGKTIEGAAGALAFACLGAWLTFTYVPGLLGGTLPQSSTRWLTFGLLVGGAGILGDLAESLLKRDLGAKDSSTWMPGFGGILDLLDSILFAAPMAYFCWLFEIH